MSKASILAAVRANKPGDRPLPTLPTYDGSPDQLLATFTASLAGSKGKVIELSELASHVAEHHPDAKQIVSAAPAVSHLGLGDLDLSTVADPLELALVDVAILEAHFAVAENGAIWVTEAEAGGHRVLPFITQHLILVVTGGVVATMHEAYARINIDDTGFGVFIAGPSKTADIEQSLVIGAHGPRSLTVVFTTG